MRIPQIFLQWLFLAASKTLNWWQFLPLRAALRIGKTAFLDTSSAALTTAFPGCLFWLCACLPLTSIATELAANVSAFAPASLAQNIPSTEPTFETLRDPETTDNRIVTALAQDTRGLIWIGTQDGLVRYDGYRFRKFTHKLDDPYSLSGNFIYSLYAAPDGRIWVGTVNDGISVFDTASERFEHFRHDQKVADSLGAGRIWALLGDNTGGMWIATDQGLNYLPYGKKRFVHFKQSANPGSLMDNKVRSLLLDQADRLWVGSSSGLQRLASDRKNFDTIVTGRDVRSLFQARDRKLWLGTYEHGAAWLDASQQAQQKTSQQTAQQIHWLPLAQMSHPWIWGIAQVKSGEIWLATNGGGIMILAPENGQVLQTLRHDPTLPSSLALDSLKPMLLDRAGWLWVGTWGAGLQRMNSNNTMLRILKHSTKRPHGLSYPEISTVLELNNGQWLIGSKGNGIDLFDRQRGLIGGYRVKPGQLGALPDVDVTALAQTRDGSIWAGTQQAGVVRQLAGSTAWVAVPGLPSKDVYRLLASRDGSLWVGTARGVARWQPGTTPQLAKQAAAPTHFQVLTDELGNTMEASTRALAEDGQGRIWVGSDNGLWLYESGQRGLVRIPAEPKRPDGLISDSVLGLLFDRHGRLWLATDKGIERLKSRDGKLSSFEHINALLGLPAKRMGGNLLEDSQGRIWTTKAVIEPIIGPASGLRINHLSLADGLEIGTAWVGAYGKTRDGLLLFGGTHGLAVIDPTHFKAYDYAPPLVVSEIKINGQAVAPAMLTDPMLTKPTSQVGFGDATSLTLQPAQRNFAIEFAALDYSEPKKIRYQYRLQGYDKDWINTNADYRIASYGNLWPGAYTLQVRGSNRVGDWSQHELNIPIRVLPAWWQTWWFGLVLLLGISAFMALVLQTRTRHLRMRQRELEQLVDERTGELRSKQSELLDANQELAVSNTALNQSNAALNQSNAALNAANTGLVLSVETLRQLGDIGREITANLDADTVFQSLYLYVGGLLNAPSMSIYRMNAAATELEPVFGSDDTQVSAMQNIALDSTTSNLARVVRERQELLLIYEALDESATSAAPHQMLSALFAPLIVDDKVLGAMSIQSHQANAYGERECMIFRTLSAYGAIALANAAALAALRQAQGQLVQQEKMASLGGLVAGIAHEINTPLGTTLVAISGVEDAWQTLLDGMASGRLNKSVLESATREGMQYTALAQRTAHRAAELVALFKTISVNDENDYPVEIELAEYLEEVAALVLGQFVQPGYTFEVSAPTGLRVQLVMDALTESLRRILANVLDHGFRNGRSGTLRLSAQVEEAEGGDEVLISVSDDGHGIAPEHLPKVFDPFFTTKGGMHGHVGLGLHVAYNHVTQRLKGKIQITSTLGAGTCVIIRIKNKDKE